MEKKQEAQYLYIAGGKTQKEIADIVGVSERTVHTWIHQYAWHKLRLAAFQAPATIADGLCAQVVELQAAIAARTPGSRFATPQEAEVMRKLIVSLEKMKKTPSLSLNMQVLETFRNYVRPLNKQFAQDLADYTDRFLSGKSRNGYAPYELEYGIAPLSPYYDEPEEPPVPPPISCPDKAECKHPGNCIFPACFMPKPSRPDPMLQYAIPPIVYERSHSSAPPVIAEDIVDGATVIPPHLAAIVSMITAPLPPLPDPRSPSLPLPDPLPPSLPLPDPLSPSLPLPDPLPLPPPPSLPAPRSLSSSHPEENGSIPAILTSAPAENSIIPFPQSLSYTPLSTEDVSTVPTIGPHLAEENNIIPLPHPHTHHIPLCSPLPEETRSIPATFTSGPVENNSITHPQLLQRPMALSGTVHGQR